MKNNPLHHRLKDILKDTVRSFIFEYVRQNEVQMEHITAIVETYFDLFYSKVLKVMSMIILSQKRKYFDLVRRVRIDKDSFLFWDQICQSYKSLARKKAPLKKALVKFVENIVYFDLIADEMIFLLNYQFKLKEHLDELINPNDSQLQKIFDQEEHDSLKNAKKYVKQMN